MRFKYGVDRAERDTGIPYWIFYVLPRMFPRRLPGPGGYASLGVSWEQGQELPIGFTKKVVGSAVANNCAACHTTNYRVRARPRRSHAPVPAHVEPRRAFCRFLIDSPRIRASTRTT